MLQIINHFICQIVKKEQNHDENDDWISIASVLQQQNTNLGGKMNFESQTMFGKCQIHFFKSRGGRQWHIDLVPGTEEEVKDRPGLLEGTSLLTASSWNSDYPKRTLKFYSNLQRQLRKKLQ